MTFHVGQKVVYVQEKPIDRLTIESVPEFRSVYTVRQVVSRTEGVGLYLNEIINPPINCWDGVLERSFPIGWFRPVVERKTDTGFQILEEILRNTKAPVTDDELHASLDRGRQ